MHNTALRSHKLRASTERTVSLMKLITFFSLLNSFTILIKLFLFCSLLPKLQCAGFRDCPSFPPWTLFLLGNTHYCWLLYSFAKRPVKTNFHLFNVVYNWSQTVLIYALYLILYNFVFHIPSFTRHFSPYSSTRFFDSQMWKFPIRFLCRLRTSWNSPTLYVFLHYLYCY